MNLLHSTKAFIDDQYINVVIEVPLGSTAKVEYDLNEENFITDRSLQPQYSYPFNYGFIPETWSGDNDPLDAIVISSRTFSTGHIAKTRIIGMLVTHDEEGSDTKLITVPDSVTDPAMANINTVDDLGQEFLAKIEYFYKNYKLIEPGKWVDIDGYHSREEAYQLMQNSIENYHQHFNK